MARDFDPIRVASEWHSGQMSALYSYCSTGKIHSLSHRVELLDEIEIARGATYGATSEEVAELEQLRHVVAAWPQEAV
jgi:hypothetical protein